MLMGFRLLCWLRVSARAASVEVAQGLGVDRLTVWGALEVRGFAGLINLYLLHKGSVDQGV